MAWSRSIDSGGSIVRNGTTSRRARAAAATARQRWPRSRRRAGTPRGPPARHGWRRTSPSGRRTGRRRSRCSAAGPGSGAWACVQPIQTDDVPDALSGRVAAPPRLSCVLIVLPPSESKTGRPRGGVVAHESALVPRARAHAESGRRGVAAASAQPDAAAILGVSTNLTAEIARNLVLHTAPAAPASRVYSGVLYDALGYATLDAAARRRANRWLVVVSALYGAVRPTDAIAPYRLSMAVNLPGVGPLAGAWRPALSRCSPRPPAVAWWWTAAPARMPRRGRPAARPPSAGCRCGCRARPIWPSTPAAWSPAPVRGGSRPAPGAAARRRAGRRVPRGGVGAGPVRPAVGPRRDGTVTT